jgi:catechol 2,3-dioxygenase-like lactoylglutathione lyase family enzyme
MRERKAGTAGLPVGRECAMALTMDAIDHLVINVNDVAASAAWYQKVLGMRHEEFSPGPGKPARTALKFGGQKINLRPATAARADWFTAERACAGSQDLCFLTSSPPAQVVDHLRQCHIAIEAGPIEKAGARGRLLSVYCRDPDGNLIEISSYRA